MVIKKNNFKKDKFEERLLNEINGLLRTGLADSRLHFVSVTKVEMSPDYGYAVVFWDTFDAHKRGDAKKAIEAAKGKIRSELAKVLDVRHVPSLSFIYDNQFDEENKIVELIKKANSSDSNDDDSEV
jgi:ribosome-binding factor A